MRRYFAVAFCLTLFCAVAFIAQRTEAAKSSEQEMKPPAKTSEETPAAPEQKQVQMEMDKAFQQMGPAMGSMMEGMMGAMFRFLAKPETAENLATFTKNYYEALIKKGFSEEEALRIVVSVGVPSTTK